MRKILRRWYIGFRIQLRILRLYFLHVQEPEDAKTPEQMLEEIKRRSDLA